MEQQRWRVAFDDGYTSVAYFDKERAAEALTGLVKSARGERGAATLQSAPSEYGPWTDVKEGE